MIMDNGLAYATVRPRVWRGHLYLCVRDLPWMRQISSHHASTQGGSFVGCVIIWRLKHIQVEFLFFSDLGVRGAGVSCEIEVGVEVEMSQRYSC